MVLASAPQLDKIYTVEEYFELEKHSDIRHEFVNGKLIAMLGESIVANRIAGNCSLPLQLAFEDTGYDILRHDIRAKINKNPIKSYRYPDVMMAKRVDITDTHAVTKPILLIEVASDNSSKTDNDDKLREYTALPSTQYYLIVDQDEPLVKVYTRDEHGWRFDVFTELEEEIHLTKLNFTLKLSQIYKNVVFAESKSDE